jgi:hypothetical protein
MLERGSSEAWGMVQKLGRRILQNPDYLLKNPSIRKGNEKATDRRDVDYSAPSFG